MTLFRSLIRAASTSDQFLPGHDQKNYTPAERLLHAVSLTNNYLIETHESACMFATVFIGILNPETGSLTYINCGNDPALIMGKDGKVHTELHPTGAAVGVRLPSKFTVKEIILAEDDLLLAFTDGIPDTQNINKEFYGNNRLRSLLTANSTPTELLNRIEASLNQFIGEADQFDDITLMAIKRKM
jgi:two-component system response regulator